MFISFEDLAGIGSWMVAITLLLVLLGFFPLIVLFWVGALFAVTCWRAQR